MKKWLFYLVILAVLVYLVAAFIPADSGYVLISLGSVSIEMTFWMAVAIVLLGIVGCWLVFKIFRGFYRGTTGGMHFLLHGSERNAQRRTSQGLIEFIEGDWKRAKRHLLKSVKKSPTPLINYLAAARSAYELGEHDEAMELLHSAEQQAPENTLAIALTQARMQLVNKKYEQCVATLTRIKSNAQSHPVILDLLKQAYINLHDWEGLRQLLPELRNQRNISEDELNNLELRISITLLNEAGAQAKREATKQAVDILQAAWQKIDKAQRQNSQVVNVYVTQLMQVGGDAQAETLLQKYLAKYWDNALARLYGLLQGADVKQQLLAAEKWLQERPGSHVLMLTLGRLCLRNELWGKAKEYFEHSLQLQKDPEAFAELARLHAHLGDHEKSTDLYQQGLLLSTHGLPKLPMPQLH